MNNVVIGSSTFSKVVCGTNPIYGHSHFSDARNREYIDRFSDACIEEMLRFCISRGIDTIESSANERIWKVISSLRSEYPLKLIGTTRIDDTSSMKSHQHKLRYLLGVKADVCVVHAQFVDRPRRNDEISGLQPLVDRIHESGSLAGISTHKVSTVELCERQGYGIDVYLFPLNMAGFVYPGYDGRETVQQRVDLIRRVPKPFVIMKALASGRIPPCDGLPFVLDSIKDNDLISLGLGSIEEAAECLALIEQHLERTD